MFGVLLDSLRDSTISDHLLSTSPNNKFFFLLEGAGGGSGNNDPGFPFFRDVELVEPSLSSEYNIYICTIIKYINGIS